MIWNLKLLAVTATATVISLAGTALYSYKKGEAMGRRQVEIEWQEAMRLQANAEAEEVMKAQQRAEALQALLAKQRKEHQRESVRLVNDYAAVVVSLQDRADRPSDGGVPEDSAVGVGHPGRCTGAELYLSDSRFLAGEAVRADQLRLALKACLAHSAEVERQLNK
jgi:hypothetical protein